MPHQKSTSNSIQNVKYTSINKDNEPGEKVKTFSSARLSEKSKDFLDNEPSSFESEDSKSRMLLNNLPKSKIVNEPGEKVKTFSSARLSEKSKDFLDNEPYQATLDNKRRKPYIITKKIVYESCAIGCKWYMIYK